MIRVLSTTSKKPNREVHHVRINVKKTEWLAVVNAMLAHWTQQWNPE
tara:strand:- start:28 stop:168 length:141 start_codon:yes stop_codon:yes gene_type:complete